MTELEEAKAFYTLKTAIPKDQRSLAENYGAVILSALTIAENSRENAFGCLASMGVPRSRAQTVANGIMVYSGRMQKEVRAITIRAETAEARTKELESAYLALNGIAALPYTIIQPCIAEWVLSKITGRDIKLSTNVQVLEAREKELEEVLTQIVKRDDWTGSECRHHAKTVLKGTPVE